MKSIKLVTHCYAKILPQFAAMLNYQLSSLVLHPNKCPVYITICCVPDDVRTIDVVNYFKIHTSLKIDLVSLSDEEIGRRAIGRNIAAKSYPTDVVWFTDVDHVFIGCLDALSSFQWPSNACMVYPHQIMIHKDHAIGDTATDKASDGEIQLWDVDQNDFTPKKYRKAIGGVQIVKGEFAREHGYLDGHPKWQRPTNTPFKDFKDDIAYRKVCSSFGSIKSVILPGIFRLRHTQTTYQ